MTYKNIKFKKINKKSSITLFTFIQMPKKRSKTKKKVGLITLPFARKRSTHKIPNLKLSLF